MKNFKSNTEKLIAKKQKEIEALNETLNSTKKAIKTAEKELAELNETLNQEKMVAVRSALDKGGVSIDALLLAVADKDILSLITDNAKSDTDTEETTVENDNNSDEANTEITE